MMILHENITNKENCIICWILTITGMTSYGNDMEHILNVIIYDEEYLTPIYMLHIHCEQPQNHGVIITNIFRGFHPCLPHLFSV